MTKGDWIVLLLSVPIGLVCAVVAGLLVEPRRWYKGEAREERERLEQIEIMGYVDNPATFTQYMVRTVVDMLRITFFATVGLVGLVVTFLIFIVARVDSHALSHFDRYAIGSYAIFWIIMIEIRIVTFIKTAESFRHRWTMVKDLEKFRRDFREKLK